jgi:micrococcal nuclease
MARPIAFMLLAFLVGLFRAVGAPAAAEGLPAGLADGGTARVAEVIDGDTVALGDGREVRLVGIQAPKLPLGRRGFKTWPLANKAKQALEGLAAGKEIALGFGTLREDRHGRVLAHLSVGGLWLQGEMLKRGLARVYTFADNRQLAPEMLALEKEARAEGRGIWADPFYAVRTADAVDARADAGSFEIVEGRVRDAAAVGKRVYLNFGDDYRSDFTAVIGPQAKPLFVAAGIDPTTLGGHIVRVRGWVETLNGPMIEITHPEQLEVNP